MLEYSSNMFSYCHFLIVFDDTSHYLSVVVVCCAFVCLSLAVMY